MTYQTRTADQSLSIGAAAQGAIGHRNDAPQPFPAKERIRHHPRKLLAFDQIKALHDLGFSRLGHRYAYEHCAVQRDRDGNILPEFDLNAMQMTKSRSDLNYSQLIHRAVDDAERIRRRMDEMTEVMRFERLRGLVKEAHRDGYLAWVMSAASLRCLIFPASYGVKRCDNVRYRFNEKDGACGTRIILESLCPSHIRRFLIHAERMCPTIDTATITPITSQTNTRTKENNHDNHDQ